MKNKNYIKKFIKHSNLIENEPFKADKNSLLALDVLITEGITKKSILKAHGILMREKNIKEKYKGAIRDIPVLIGGVIKKKVGIILESQLETLVELNNESSYENIEEVYNTHLLFEEIHPFIDGNGRIGRLIFLQTILKNNLLRVYFNEPDKHKYYMTFKGSTNLSFFKKYE